MAEKRRPIHTQPKLCDHILRGVANCGVPLRIAASSIPKAGSGLFVINDVAAGSEIFRSQPVLVVCEGNDLRVCDYCFCNPSTRLHPEGRFYSAGEKTVTLSACTGCKNVEYCSKVGHSLRKVQATATFPNTTLSSQECQSRAWRSYHKHECPIVKELLENKKIMGAVPHALARLLLWVKKQTMSEDDFAAIVALEHHCDERADRWMDRFENDEDAVLEPTLAMAYQVKQSVNSKLGLGQVQKLACILQHNAGAIRPPGVLDQYGTFLDLLVSTINHSCDANTNTFFEGRELRCRAIKDIPAGTEITLNYYPTPRFDVLLRRSILDQHMYIKCNCQLCRSEIAEHLAEAPKRHNHLGKVKEAQDKLDRLGKDALDAFSSSRVLTSCIAFQRQIATLVEKGYPSGRWPDHIEPLPRILRQLGAMYRELEFAIGLEFELKGTLYVRDKTDPNWTADFHNLVKHILFMAQAGDNDIKWVAAESKSVLERADMRYVARGYLIILCLGARMAFGMDSKFVQALYHWTGDLLECGEDAKLHTDLFREIFEFSQKRLIEWAEAGVHLALQLPPREQVAELEKDIRSLSHD
ncbi:hypothetical protein N0V93_007709 [Gnomoniopsis smithogilvyi]|uniref:SET domain-containing protein n=1 Tax=Gnomoniopsis smithogilvyi TaxID=1191159 RepID=A0A9W9CT78_9PEZI|nr:hypothetical protein N0V93_007709 [Gnomoniopsis smithogilvyi]